MQVKREADRQWMSAGFPGGDRALLHLSREEGRTSIVRVTAGARAPKHRHNAPEHVLVLSGKLRIGAVDLEAGDYLYTDAGEEHDLLALEDSVFFATTSRAVQVLDNAA